MTVKIHKLIITNFDRRERNIYYFNTKRELKEYLKDVFSVTTCVLGIDIISLEFNL